MSLKERTYALTTKGIEGLLGVLQGIVAAPLQACLNAVLPRIVDVISDVLLLPVLKALTGLLKNVPLVGPSLVRAVDYLFERVSEIFPVELDRYTADLAEEELYPGEGTPA